MDVGIRELKLHLSEYLARVRKGEVVTVTDRGKPIARIGPVPPLNLPPSMQRLIAEGRMTYRPWRPENLPEPLKMLPGEKTFADYVSEQRR